MNSLELVRKIYEDDTDLDALREELDESSQEELRQLVEARDALSELPRRRPPAGLIDAVVEKAVGNRKKTRPGLTLITAGGMLQRLAAAAVVVVAIGVGYLALRTDTVLLLENKEVATASPESPAVSESEQFAAEDEIAEEISGREADIASEAEPLQRRAPAAPSRQKIAGAVTSGEGLATVPRDNDMMLADAEKTTLDSMAGKERTDARELLSWDDEEEALRTLFWQVRALDGRSPDDKWEEAVPLEGSFERLEKQRPNGDHWLQTGTQR